MVVTPVLERHTEERNGEYFRDKRCGGKLLLLGMGKCKRGVRVTISELTEGARAAGGQTSEREVLGPLERQGQTTYPRVHAGAGIQPFPCGASYRQTLAGSHKVDKTI